MLITEVEGALSGALFLWRKHMTKIVQKKIAGYGFRRDSKDDRDHIFDHAASLAKLGTLPPTVDLSQHCPPVMDQGQLGSCTAHGITGALRYAMIAAGQGDFDMARLQLYYDERVVEGTVKSDAGAEIRDGIKCAAGNGVGHETLWPYAVKASHGLVC